MNSDEVIKRVGEKERRGGGGSNGFCLMVIQ